MSPPEFTETGNQGVNFKIRNWLIFALNFVEGGDTMETCHHLLTLKQRGTNPVSVSQLQLGVSWIDYVHKPMLRSPET